MLLYEAKIAQHLEEIDGFIEILKDEGATSYLEIGSQYGGSLWRVANALPSGSRMVSIDLPYPGHGTDVHLKRCIEALCKRGYDARVIIGDSTKPNVIADALRDGPFDALFIDGNHTLAGVTQDWQNYGPHARVVGFHDIVWDRPVRQGRLPIEVSHLWRQIKGDYRHKEIVSEGSEKGIGVLWR